MRCGTRYPSGAPGAHAGPCLGAGAGVSLAIWTSQNWKHGVSESEQFPNAEGDETEARNRSYLITVPVRRVPEADAEGSVALAGWRPGAPGRLGGAPRGPALPGSPAW